jgi:hypothetical protein
MTQGENMHTHKRKNTGREGTRGRVGRRGENVYSNENKSTGFLNTSIYNFCVFTTQSESDHVHAT